MNQRLFNNAKIGFLAAANKPLPNAIFNQTQRRQRMDFMHSPGVAG
jgi:hypothetical protein